MPCTKKFYVPMVCKHCFDSEDFRNECLTPFIKLNPPDGLCGFLPVYRSREEMREAHPTAEFWPLTDPLGSGTATVISFDKESFPRQARGFLFVYGTIALRRDFQDPAIKFFSVETPWIESAPGETDFAAGRAVCSAPNPTEKPAKPSLGGLNQLGPDWQN